MKFRLPYLKLGETVRGQVVEILASNEIIINFDGDLVRVGNETNAKVRVGDRIDLIVTALQPLQFRLAIHPEPRQKRLHRLDISG